MVLIINYFENVSNTHYESFSLLFTFIRFYDTVINLLDQFDRIGNEAKYVSGATPPQNGTLACIPGAKTCLLSFHKLREIDHIFYHFVLCESELFKVLFVNMRVQSLIH